MHLSCPLKPMMCHITRRDHLRGQSFRPGIDEHHASSKPTTRAKLEPHPDIASAFVTTRSRLIVHETGYPEKPDAEFPHTVFCKILTELSENFSEVYTRGDTDK